MNKYCIRLVWVCRESSLKWNPSTFSTKLTAEVYINLVCDVGNLSSLNCLQDGGWRHHCCTITSGAIYCAVFIPVQSRGEKRSVQWMANNEMCCKCEEVKRFPFVNWITCGQLTNFLLDCSQNQWDIPFNIIINWVSSG